MSIVNPCGELKIRLGKLLPLGFAQGEQLSAKLKLQN
jgi:hypothetical protein